MTEVELCRHARAYLESLGYEVYEEVAVDGAGVVDLVGKMGPEKFSRDLRGKERGLGAQSISRKDPPT